MRGRPFVQALKLTALLSPAAMAQDLPPEIDFLVREAITNPTDVTPAVMEGQAEPGFVYRRRIQTKGYIGVISVADFPPYWTPESGLGDNDRLILAVKDDQDVIIQDDHVNGPSCDQDILEINRRRPVRWGEKGFNERFMDAYRRNARSLREHLTPSSAPAHLRYGRPHQAYSGR